jgi:Cdc6-like AAA superfamily ATPase
LNRSSWTPREIDSLIFSHGKHNLKKKTENLQSLYSIDDFRITSAFNFVDARIKGRDNFLIFGSSDVGKTQLVCALLFYYFKATSQYLVISTKEELKLVCANHQSIILDDFEWNTLSREEVIRLLDRDKPAKMITCKFENSIIYNYQQIIVISNQIPDVFRDDKAILSRIMTFDESISSDLRSNDSLARRSTHRGNHLLQYSNEVSDSIV